MNYLREAMKKGLDFTNGEPATFDFNVQLRNDESLPIEDATAEWSETTAPPQNVATIEIDRQDFDNPFQVTECEHMAFTPWHGLTAHQPIGGINRLRLGTYIASSKFRALPKEPTDFQNGQVTHRMRVFARASLVSCLALASPAYAKAPVLTEQAPGAPAWQAEQEKRIEGARRLYRPEAGRLSLVRGFSLRPEGRRALHRAEAVAEARARKNGEARIIFSMSRASLSTTAIRPIRSRAASAGRDWRATIPMARVDFATMSCGACHIGRVRLDDGSLRYLDGGVNAQFNLAQYRIRVINTIKKITAGATTPEEKIERATQAMLSALDKVHAQEQELLLQELLFAGRRFDAAYEARQIELFKQDATAIVGKYLDRAGLEFFSLLDLIYKNYKGFEEQMAQGFGGMADATGVSTSMVYAAAGRAEKFPIRKQACRRRRASPTSWRFGSRRSACPLVPGSHAACRRRRTMERQYSDSDLP